MILLFEMDFVVGNSEKFKIGKKKKKRRIFTLYSHLGQWHKPY
jgi:hypothetical protein